MRTTYRGINRAQAMKRYREVLEHQKLKLEKKQKKTLGWVARRFIDLVSGK